MSYVIAANLIPKIDHKHINFTDEKSRAVVIKGWGGEREMGMRRCWPMGTRLR